MTCLGGGCHSSRGITSSSFLLRCAWEKPKGMLAAIQSFLFQWQGRGARGDGDRRIPT